MNHIELLRNLLISQSPDYGEDINNLIYNHNAEIDHMVTDIAYSALYKLLIDKGLITDEEYMNKAYEVCEHATVQYKLKKLSESYDKIVDLVQCQQEYLEDMEDVCDNLDETKYHADVVSSDVIDDVYNPTKE